MRRGHRYAGSLAPPDRARHFGGPSIPKSQPPPPPPAKEDKPSQEEAAKERARLRARKGRAGTLLAGDTLGARSTLGTSDVEQGTT